MKYTLLLSAVVLLFSCKEQAKQPENTATAKEPGWTKPLITPVDAATTYFDDMADEDFSDYSNLVSQLFEEVYAGRLKAYHFIDGHHISIDEIKEIGSQMDTTYTQDPQSGELIGTVNRLDKSITSVKLKETWHFNKETLQLEKKVLGVAPRIEVYDMATGQIKGYTPVFWVFFDKEAEEAFAAKKPL